MSDKLIKVGMCIAYDWHLLSTSLPRIYKHADLICLSIDKNRRAWSGVSYEFDNDAFHSLVQQIDIDKKIIIYEDDFSLSNLDKRQNCNRQRSMIAEKMGVGGWHIQIDADEYFLNFEGFVKYLIELNENPQPTQKAINVCCPFIPLIKKTEQGYLYVNFKDRLPEIIPIATNKPDYQRARQNGHFNHVSTYYVVHDTWSRGEEELWFKINNWGHADEELSAARKRASYYRFWSALDEYNYHFVANFHPADLYTWPGLGFCEGANIEEFINNFKIPIFPLSNIGLWAKNSRNVSRLVFYYQKIVKSFISKK